MIFPFLDSGCVIFLRWSSVLAFNSSSRLCAKLFRSVSSSPTMMCRIVIRSLIPALKRASYFFLPFLKKSLQELDTKKNGVLLPHLNWKYSIPTSQSLVEFNIFYTVLCFGDRLILRSAVSLSPTDGVLPAYHTYFAIYITNVQISSLFQFHQFRPFRRGIFMLFPSRRITLISSVFQK